MTHSWPPRSEGRFGSPWVFRYRRDATVTIDVLATLRATTVESARGPLWMATSMPSCTRSTLRSVTTISTVISGKRAATRGANHEDREPPNPGVRLRRRRRRTPGASRRDGHHDCAKAARDFDQGWGRVRPGRRRHLGRGERSRGRDSGSIRRGRRDRPLRRRNPSRSPGESSPSTTTIGSWPSPPT
jgi:hypothetical protein